MTVCDIDIYRSAKLLIDQHGDAAAIEAAMKADAMLDKGDLEGAAVWRRIVAAINDLQREGSVKLTPERECLDDRFHRYKNSRIGATAFTLILSSKPLGFISGLR